MTPGIDYALGALLCFGLGDLIYKRAAAAGAQPHHFMMVQTWFFLPAVFAYGWFTGSLAFDAAALWGALAGLFVIIGYYNFAHSLKSGAVSIVAPVFRLSFALTAALAVLLLGEPLTARKLAGLALALAAVWLLLGAPAAVDHALRRQSRSLLLRVLVATVAVALANLIYKFGLRAGASPATLVVAQACVASTLATAFSAKIDCGIHPSRVALRHAPYAAVVLALAFILLLKGLALGEASILVPVAQMGFVVTALLGFLFLHEPFTPRKGVGLAAALAALASFAYG
jgi:drug/metabolite transporter (DMT)-like permease